MRYVIFDFEVFKHDTLLGLIFIDGEDKKLFQTWDLSVMREIYRRGVSDNIIWVGHNNFHYDNAIYEAIMAYKNPYEASKDIITGKSKGYSKVDFLSWDIMTTRRSPFSLKVTELIRGENIHTSEIDFDINRVLTEDEKRLVEKYNQDDLEATLYNFNMFSYKLALKLDLIEEFKLPKKAALRATDTKLSAMVLGAKRIAGIENMRIPPVDPPNLILKNQDILDFYHSERFRNFESEIIHIGNADLHIGSGGLHQAIPKCHYDKLLYCDVSGYYNLVMMNYDLLPRSVGDEGKRRYIDMYHQQLAMKKTNPIKRGGYKIVLLSVFGAEINEYSDFYDPQKGYLVTITGQLFLCDLLEKLEDHVTIVQTNTDGIMIEPKDWSKEKEIISIIEEWERRTGFVIKKEHIYDVWQRDVNNYVLRDEKGNIECKGEALGNWLVDDDSYKKFSLIDAVNPPIIARGVVEYLMNRISPEETVDRFKHDLRYFQYSCKKGTFDSLEHEGKEIQSPSRAFASLKGREPVLKVKGDKKSKIANLPPSAIIYNGKLSEAPDLKIDWKWYINRIKERIEEFDSPMQLTLW